MTWLKKSNYIYLDPNALRRYVNASGLSRIFDQITSGEFGIMSAFRPQYSLGGNRERTAKLKEMIREMGYGFVQASGVWKDASEDSLFIPGISKEDIQKLSTEFQQEAFIWGDGENYYVIATDTGAVLDSGNPKNQFHFLGTGEEADPADAYTEMKGRRWTFSPQEEKEIAPVAEAEYYGGFRLKSGRAFCFTSKFDLDRKGQSFFFLRGFNDKYGSPRFGVAVHNHNDNKMLDCGNEKMILGSLAIYLPLNPA